MTPKAIKKKRPSTHIIKQPVIIRIAFDGLTKDMRKAELRSGNTYCSTGAADFFNPLLEHYNQTVPVSTILVRADSGFAAPEL